MCVVDAPQAPHPAQAATGEAVEATSGSSEPASQRHRDPPPVEQPVGDELDSRDAAASRSNGKKKRRSSKSAGGGPPKRPKRPKTAYHFFYDLRRTELVAEAEAKAEGGNVDNNAISARIGEEWKSVGDRSMYETLAEAARVEYDKAVEAYEASGQSMADCQPKKPLSAYMLFFQAKHAETPDASVTDFAKSTGAEWKKLSDDDKRPFLEAAKRQRDLWTAQTHLVSKSKRDLVGATFLDACASSRNATVAAYDDDTDLYTIAYDDAELDDHKAARPVSLSELRARICGDDKAVKKLRDQAHKSATPKHHPKAKKHASGSKSLPPATPPQPPRPLANPAPAPPSPTEKSADVLADEDMINVIRLSRRLVGGACVQNLKKMCTTVGLPVGGTKADLGTRLELYLRHHNFKDHPFQPSVVDVQDLSIDDFNDKYQNQTPHSINDIVKLLQSFHDP